MYSWGREGHRIAAAITEADLSPAARDALAELLGGESLARISTYADEVRENPDLRCGGPFHYVNIDDGETYWSQRRSSRGDIIAGLVYLEDRLRDSAASRRERALALRYYVHLLSDLHQPLHVGRSCDRGGVAIRVRYWGKNTSLHSVWDGRLLYGEKRGYTKVARDLLRSGRAYSRLESAGTYLDWADESMLLRERAYICYRCAAARDADRDAVEFGACSTVEDYDAPVQRLSREYTDRNLPLVRLQLWRAGIRTAAMLNQIFSGRPLSLEQRELRRRLGQGGERIYGQCLARDRGFPL